MSNHLRYWAHLKLAQLAYHSLGILESDQFGLVDWEMVHSLLHCAPKLFQLWACKQVKNIAATNANVFRWDKLVATPLCPRLHASPGDMRPRIFCCHFG
jgi:hypothetical protein